MRSSAKRVGAMAGLCLAVAACVAPFTYQPIGPDAPYGYRDTANADGGYTILVVMPQTERDLTKAQTFWDQRASELCGGGPFRKIMFRARIENYYYDNYGSRYGNYYLEGYAYCGNEAPPAAATPAAAEVVPAPPQAPPAQ